MGHLASHRQLGERYLLLRFLGGLFCLMGSVLVVASCVLLAVGLYSMRGDFQGSTASPVLVPSSGVSGPAWLAGGLLLVWSLGLLVSGLQSVAIGAAIRLAVHLEENTRVAAQCLETLRSRTDPALPEPGPIFRS